MRQAHPLAWLKQPRNLDNDSAQAPDVASKPKPKPRVPKKRKGATFWSLPRSVRDEIYRIHLVQDTPITVKAHRAIIQYDAGKRGRSMPPLLSISPKAEKEGRKMYYGENHFEATSATDVRRLIVSTWPRHLKLIRKITYSWSTSDRWDNPYASYCSAAEAFTKLATLKALTELNIRIDEVDMIDYMTFRPETTQREVTAINLRPEQHSAILRFPSISELLKLSHVTDVNFIKMANHGDDEEISEWGGPLPEGPLATQIVPRLRTSTSKSNTSQRQLAFRFLDLPPELRNHVYRLLMRIPGLTHPSKESPSSAPQDGDATSSDEGSYRESSLGLLAVNKQIHNEAIGVYYGFNAFLFHYPAQLSTFILSIGTHRQKWLRDVTIHYRNSKSGGIEIIDIALLQLKQLPVLRRLHILMVADIHETTLRRGWYTNHYNSSHQTLCICSSNPGQIPGMKTLFTLRGLTDIKLRDLGLEEELEAAEQDDDEFPSSPRDRMLLQLDAALDHMNDALADAQLGKVNEKLLRMKDWHMFDIFPTLDHDGVRDVNAPDAKGEDSDSDHDGAY